MKAPVLGVNATVLLATVTVPSRRHDGLSADERGEPPGRRGRTARGGLSRPPRRPSPVGSPLEATLPVSVVNPEGTATGRAAPSENGVGTVVVSTAAGRTA